MHVYCSIQFKKIPRNTKFLNTALTITEFLFISVIKNFEKNYWDAYCLPICAKKKSCNLTCDLCSNLTSNTLIQGYNSNVVEQNILYYSPHSIHFSIYISTDLKIYNFNIHIIYRYI